MQLRWKTPTVTIPYASLRNRHFFVADLVLITVASYLSFVLRLETNGLAIYLPGLVLFTGLALLLIPTTFRIGGVYARYWRFASVEELLLLAGSVTTATVLTGVVSFGVCWLVADAIQLPRSIPFIFLLLAVPGVAMPRLALRLAARPRASGEGNLRPVLIMGAGSAGRMIVRELKENPHLGMRVIGLLDDDSDKHGMRIHGVPILGGRNDIRRLALLHDIERVIIAIPTASGKTIREIMNICEQSGVQAKTMPGIYELLGGMVSVSQLRDVQIEDLLRRPPVQADCGAIAGLIAGKRILVTGGGGSIGSELCRQILHCNPAELIVLGHGENSVFEIQNELRRTLAGRSGDLPQISGVIADIRFPERLGSIFEEYRPNIVFHAAAHKHVPLMEANPEEAITNNVLGTRNVINAARAVDVERFVMISSDKAVNPTNVMGACKRVAEFLVHEAAEATGKPYVAVRFGNVLGSRGSVVLTFKQQIANGGPLTLTHPEMTRYFMTIPEAVTLVLQAAVLGNGGEVFVLDMGQPVKIADLAKDMIELSGLQVGRDIDIIYSGMRPGEKLFEELFISGEDYHRTKHQKVFTAANAGSLVPAWLEAGIAELECSAKRGDKVAIRRGLQALVKEYHPTDLQPTKQVLVTLTAPTSGKIIPSVVAA